MRPNVKLAGVVGGGLGVLGGIVALVVGGADTVIVGGWITIAAGAIGIVGAVLAGGRSRLAALLMIVAAVVAGLVAPGVIPALADTVVVFFAYLAGVALLLLGAILAFVDRNAVRTDAVTGLSD